MQLTLIQQEAIDQAEKHAGILVRWEGGFWTFEGAQAVGKDRHGLPTPEWYCTTNTVFALVRRGRMVMSSPTQCSIKQ